MARCSLAIVLLCALLGQAAHAEPDETALGKAQGYPVGTIPTWTHTPYRVGSWSQYDQIPGVRVSIVPASPQPRPLPPLADAPAIKYRYRNIGYTLAEYLDRQRTTGLLVLKDGKVVAEHYRYERKPEHRFLSWSMSKSVVSLLVGVAQANGAIASLDDAAEKYAKGLAGTAYGATSIRHLLRMSSGLVFTERYESGDDVMRMGRAFATSSGGSTEVLRSISNRHAPAGQKFAYASGETEVLGYVLQGATGKTLSELTRDWLWAPIGAEREAFWRIGANGQEGSWGFFNASLRDWGRLGAMLAADGKVGERQVVPREYLLAATDPAQQPLSHQPGRPTPFHGYGYQFWLLPMKERSFVMQGIHGQHLYVQPSSGIVMVVTSVWDAATGWQDPGPWRETDALWSGVLQTLGGNPE